MRNTPTTCPHTMNTRNYAVLSLLVLVCNLGYATSSDVKQKDTTINAPGSNASHESTALTRTNTKYAKNTGDGTSGNSLHAKKLPFAKFLPSGGFDEIAQQLFNDFDKIVQEIPNIGPKSSGSEPSMSDTFDKWMAQYGSAFLSSSVGGTVSSSTTRQQMTAKTAKGMYNNVDLKSLDDSASVVLVTSSATQTAPSTKSFFGDVKTATAKYIKTADGKMIEVHKDCNIPKLQFDTDKLLWKLPEFEPLAKPRVTEE